MNNYYSWDSYMKTKTIMPWSLIKETFTISWRPVVSDWHRNWEESGLQTHPQPIQLVPNSFNNFASQIPLSWPPFMERLHLARLFHGLKFLSKQIIEWTLIILWPVIMCKKSYDEWLWLYEHQWSYMITMNTYHLWSVSYQWILCMISDHRWFLTDHAWTVVIVAMKYCLS